MFYPPLLIRPAKLSRPESKNKYLSSRRLYKLRAKISGHSVEIYPIYTKKNSYYRNFYEL